ncbi:uncharacterized protein LOC120914273 isoform X2 [Rana temporaria]|nr:uncharacterized protein LOC120914273 isoform X2 [Rana temporaria]
MGSCHSVKRGSKKREDISYSDIECKHGKIWNTLAPRDDHHSLTSVFRFCLFMGVSCNNMQNDEEQNPVAVRKPKNCLLLLKQLKTWIAKNFSGFNAAKVTSLIYQEPIYRSPGVGQQTVNARYSIVLQIQNQDAIYQGANRFQMLPWDAHGPPSKRVTRDGSWYIVSMKVFKDEMDLGSQCPDNPDVPLKVILHVANHMPWTPPVVNPCFLNYHVDNTLSPEELRQLIRIPKYLLPNEQPKYPIPKDTSTLIPGLLEFNHDAIPLDCRTLNISSNLYTVLHFSYYKSDFYLNFINPVPSTIIPNTHWFNNEAIHEDQDVNADGKFKKCPPYTNIKAEDTRTLVPGPPKFNHLDYRNLNISSNPNTVLDSSYYKSGFNLNFPNLVPSTINPNPSWFNNEATHEDHQGVNANGDSNKCPLSTNIKAGNSAAAGFKAFWILLALASPTPAYPVPQGHQVGIEILRDSDNLNCTLKIDNKFSLCYGHCDQNLKHYQNISDDTVENLLGKLCKRQERVMEANQISLMGKHSLSSGILQLILIWELDKVFNVVNVIIQYIFNDKKLTDEEMTYLPMTITDFWDSDPNSPVYMEKMKEYVKEVWESIREKILPFLKIDVQPEKMNSSVNARANTRRWIIAIAIFVVSFIGAISIVRNIK